MRPFTIIAVSLAALALLIALGFWFTAGVSGEVFLLSPDGKPQSAPGAEVHVYRCDDGHSMSAFLMGTLNLAQTWKDADAKFPQSRPELMDHRSHMVQGLIYMDVFVKVSNYWQAVVAQTTTDRNGGFSVQLTPGNYVIHVSGQAGKYQAHWLRQVRVVWRSETRLSTPVYSYISE